MKKLKIRNVKLGELKPGSRALWYQSLNLNPVPVEIVEVGEIQKGGFQDWQDVYFKHPDFNRQEHATVMQSGSDTLVMSN